MSFLSTIVIAVIGLALLIVITHLIIGRYTKRRFWKSFAIAHVIFMLIASLLYFPGEKDAQHQLFWLTPAALDFPFSLLMFVFTTNDLIISILILAMLGTLQYAIIGWLVDLALFKLNKSSKHE